MKTETFKDKINRDGHIIIYELEFTKIGDTYNVYDNKKKGYKEKEISMLDLLCYYGKLIRSHGKNVKRELTEDQRIAFGVGLGKKYND